MELFAWLKAHQRSIERLKTRPSAAHARSTELIVGITLKNGVEDVAFLPAIDIAYMCSTDLVPIGRLNEESFLETCHALRLVCVRSS